MKEIWIFGYGSLIWNPGFPFKYKEKATLKGYKRDYCILTTRHRGDQKQKGIVLGLKEKDSAVCQGKAFLIDEKHKDDILQYLEERENGNEKDVYHQKEILLWLEDQQKWKKAITFVANPENPAFIDTITLEEKISIITKAKGHSGTNLEYFLNTYSTLSELNIQDNYLDSLYNKL